MAEKLQRQRRSSAALVGALAVIVALGGVVAAGAQATAQGNSENSKACQKGGWENLVRSDGTAFASQDECISYAAKGGVLQPNLCKQALAAAGLSEPTDPNYILGTSGDDDFTGRMTDGNDVVCGFAGNDGIGSSELEGDDIFLGGDGSDGVSNMSGGTFEGGADVDSVGFGGSRAGLFGGMFNGGDGNDRVNEIYGGTFDGGDGNDRVEWMYGVYGGMFNGGAGNDGVEFMLGGMFNGGAGDDSVFRLGALEEEMESGTFNGGDGNDLVESMDDGMFNGGDGVDVVVRRSGGTCSEVELGCVPLSP